MAWHAVWEKELPDKNSRDKHEHKFIVETLQEMLTRDKLNVLNLKTAEKLVRRARYIERKQKREQIGVSKARQYHSSSRDAHGGVATPAFDAWVEQKEKEDAKKLKTEADFIAAAAAAKAAGQKKKSGE